MKLLKQLYEVHSPSRNEKAIQEYILKFTEKNGYESTMDKTGNILVTKGKAKTYPCIVAHLDEVHSTRPEGFKVVVYKDNYLMGGNIETLRPCGIGADDKNGIWVALNCLKKFKFAKAAFFVGEEIGCVGSAKVDMSFFDDCRFVIQCDRNGKSDFISNACRIELCDEKFIEQINLKKFGYKKTSGMMTDVMTLKSRGLKVACCNLSCGYYEPHTADEYTSFIELQNCLDFVCHIFMTIKTVCKHVDIPKYDISYRSNQCTNSFEPQETINRERNIQKELHHEFYGYKKSDADFLM